MELLLIFLGVTIVLQQYYAGECLYSQKMQAEGHKGEVSPAYFQIAQKINQSIKASILRKSKCG